MTTPRRELSKNIVSKWNSTANPLNVQRSLRIQQLRLARLDRHMATAERRMLLEEEKQLKTMQKINQKFNSQAKRTRTVSKMVFGSSTPRFSANDSKNKSPAKSKETVNLKVPTLKSQNPKTLVLKNKPSVQHKSTQELHSTFIKLEDKALAIGTTEELKSCHIIKYIPNSCTKGDDECILVIEEPMKTGCLVSEEEDIPQHDCAQINNNSEYMGVICEIETYSTAPLCLEDKKCSISFKSLRQSHILDMERQERKKRVQDAMARIRKSGKELPNAEPIVTVVRDHHSLNGETTENGLKGEE